MTKGPGVYRRFATYRYLQIGKSEDSFFFFYHTSPTAACRHPDVKSRPLHVTRRRILSLQVLSLIQLLIRARIDISLD